MQVIFERVDARRYRIGAVRDGRRDVGPDVDVRPAPGPAAVPHDLVHFVVEEQAGLSLGIFGQVAAGGDVGGFFRSTLGSRRPVAEVRRSARLGRAGRTEVARSERLAALVRPDGRLREAEDLDPRLHAAIAVRLQEVLDRWRSVPPGGRLVLGWPERLTVRAGATRSRRAAPAVGRAGVQTTAR